MGGQPHFGLFGIAALNTSLGHQIGGPVAATAAAFAVGLAVALVLLVVNGVPSRDALAFDRPWIWFGAVFILFYAVSVTFAAPRIGLGNAIFFVLLGQLVAAAAIDHFGWLGVVPSTLTLRRALGIAIMALGVWFARKPL